MLYLIWKSIYKHETRCSSPKYLNTSHVRIGAMEVYLANCIQAKYAKWTISGAFAGHLRLEPEGSFHAFFTGDSFFITCFASETSGATRLTWQGPTGRDITVSHGRVHVEAAPQSPLGLELVVEDVKYKDQGTYTCSAIVDGAEVRIHFKLQVYLSISFLGTPTEQFGSEASDYMVLCNVRSDPSPIVSWYVNGSLILDGPRHTVTEDGLYIRSLKRTDAGNYTCKAFVVTAHNSQMKDIHIQLDVHCHIARHWFKNRPVWHTPYVDKSYGIVGATANLTCQAHAQPPPVFEWFRDRQLLGNSRLYRIINRKWKSILQVRIRDNSAFGPYQCVVSNKMGEVQRIISLFEGVHPNPPSVVAKSSEPGIIELRMYPSPTDPLPVIGYRIQCRLATDSWGLASDHHIHKESEFVLQDLGLESDYVIRVAALNAIGYSNYSEEVVQRTKGLIAETVRDGSSVSSPNAEVSQACRHQLQFREFRVVSIFIFALLLSMP